jgi:hypothetical protein
MDNGIDQTPASNRILAFISFKFSNGPINYAALLVHSKVNVHNYEAAIKDTKTNLL